MTDPLAPTVPCSCLACTPAAPPRRDVPVLGLDPSLTATGIALPHGYTETVRIDGGDDRLLTIHSRITGICATYGVGLAVVEDLPTHARAAGLTGMAQGVIRHALLEQRIPYVTVPPSVVKKYATGRGNAPKTDLRMALYKRVGVDLADDNQVDAAWLRLLGLDLLGRPEVQMPAGHRTVLDKLRLTLDKLGVEAR